MTDNPRIEVGDIEGTIGAELDVHGAEPAIVRDEEIFLDRRRRRTLSFEAETVEAVRDDIADVGAIAKLRREVESGIVGDAGDRGRAAIVVDHLRPEAEPIVR